MQLLSDASYFITLQHGGSGGILCYAVVVRPSLFHYIITLWQRWDAMQLLSDARYFITL